MPTPSKITLIDNLVRVSDGSAEAARAKITPKKNKTATAMAPNKVTIFTFNCGVESHNLILPFNHVTIFRYLISTRTKI